MNRGGLTCNSASPHADVPLICWSDRQQVMPRWSSFPNILFFSSPGYSSWWWEGNCLWGEGRFCCKHGTPDGGGRQKLAFSQFSLSCHLSGFFYIISKKVLKKPSAFLLGSGCLGGRGWGRQESAMLFWFWGKLVKLVHMQSTPLYKVHLLHCNTNLSRIYIFYTSLYFTCWSNPTQMIAWSLHTMG